MAEEETDREPRDVKNHLLFEIATEVAHRGTSPVVYPPTNHTCWTTDTAVQSAAFTRSSNPSRPSPRQNMAIVTPLLDTCITSL